MSIDSLAILVLTVIVMVLAWAWYRARHRIHRANRRRQQRASAGEADAEALLEAAGFQVLDRQITARWTLFVDGAPVDVSCRADLLVRARSKASLPRNQRFIAEVKTGDRAIEPTHPATRRQLMEYLHAFDVDGVLLVDMTRRCVRHVEF